MEQSSQLLLVASAEEPGGREGLLVTANTRIPLFLPHPEDVREWIAAWSPAGGSIAGKPAAEGGGSILPSGLLFYAEPLDTGVSCAVSGLTLDTGPTDITRSSLEFLAYGAVSVIDGAKVPENVPIHGGGPLFGSDSFAKILAHTAGRTLFVVPSGEIYGYIRKPVAGAQFTLRRRYDPDPSLHTLFTEAYGGFRESVKKLACSLQILADIEKDV
jgi:hypothetical protein